MTPQTHAGSAPRPGDTIADWRIIDELGAGSYGAVYRVEREGLFFALKLAHRRADDSDEGARREERTQRELDCLLALRHPNIARVWSHGRWPHPTQGQVYLVLDYVDGFTLGKWKEDCAPTPHEIVVLFERLARALAYMHQRGVKHRDLKPANIMVGRQDRAPVVVDYGAADRTGAESLTDERLPPGTPRHTSPEAARFDREHRNDPNARYEYTIADEIYAFGVTLYDVLTVPRLHTAPNYQAVTSEVIEPRLAHLVNPRVPVALSELTAELISRKPAQRPVDFEVVRRKLAEFLPLQGEEWQDKPIEALARVSANSQPRMEQAGPGRLRERVAGLAGRLWSSWAPRAGAKLARAGKRLMVPMMSVMLVVLALFGSPLVPVARNSSPPLVVDVIPLPEMQGAGETKPAPLEPPLEPPSRKGRPVKKAVVDSKSAPSICSRKEPPPASEKALLREWCRCTGLVSAAVLASACAGRPLSPPSEPCPDEAVATFVKYDYPDVDAMLLDETQPDGPDHWGVFKDGPITGVQVRGDFPAGTRFFGEVWTGPILSPNSPGQQHFHIRYTRFQVPGGKVEPICFVAGNGSGRMNWSEGSQTGAAIAQRLWPLTFVKRWP